MLIHDKLASLVSKLRTKVTAGHRRFSTFVLLTKIDRKILRALAAILTVAVSTSIGLVVMEGITRILRPEFDPSGRFELRYHVGGLELGYPGTKQRQIKNTGDYNVAVSINRYGLRDTKNIAKAKPDDIVVVGDSFAWGWGVEEDERFSNVLEGLTGHKAYNLATPTDIEGYEELLRYGKSLGAHYGQIVMSICMENDLRVYGRPAAETVTQPVIPALHNRPLGLANLWLISHSAVYVMLTSVVYRTPWAYNLAVKAGVLIPNLDGITSNRYDPAVIRTSADYVQRLSKQYQLLVVLVPSRGLWAGPNRATEDRVHRELFAALAARGVKVVDMRPIFEATGKPLGYYFANDGHWVPRGHKLAAEAIASCLEGRRGCRSTIRLSGNDNIVGNQTRR